MIVLDTEKAKKRSVDLIRTIRKRQFIERFLKYKKIEDVPEWAVKSVRKAIAYGYIPEDFVLTYKDIQCFYILDTLNLLEDSN